MNILFFHNTLAPYRIPFFKALAQKTELKLAFTNITEVDRIYKESGTTAFLEEINYVVIDKKKCIAQIRDLVCNGSWDVINLPTPDGIYELFTCYLIAFFAKRAHKKTAIFWIRWIPDSVEIPRKQRFKTFVRNTLVKPIVRNVDVCICSGKMSEKNFLSLGVPAEKIKRMHYSTDVYLNCEDIDIYHTYSIPRNKKILLYFGRVISRKGLRELLKAYQQLKVQYADLALVVAGSGDEYYAACQSYVSKNEMEDVYFVGQISSKYRKNFFEASEIFVLPSLFEKGVPEPWGQTVNEALQCGCPVVATTAVGAAYDVLNETNGIMAESTVDGLKKSIEAVLNRECLKEQIKNSIRAYTCDAMADDFVNAYQTIK